MTISTEAYDHESHDPANLAEVEAAFFRAHPDRLAEHMEALARANIEALMMPACIECGSTRDLTHCASCTDAGEGMYVLCPAHVAKHLAEVEECRTDNEFKPIAEDFRFTHYN